MMDAGRHPNITLLTYSEVEAVSGYVGNFTVRIRKRARSVDEEKCTGCGACQEKCPTKVVDTAYEAGLGYRKAIYRPFAQAVPPVPVLDRANCLWFTRGRCRLCEKVCPTGAIDYNQQDTILEVQVGNIILATGYDPFDARRIPQFGYGRFPNVFTALEIERMLSGAGPTGGRVVLRDGETTPAGRHHPLRRQPGPELPRILLPRLLHVQPETGPPHPPQDRRRGLQLLH